MIEGLTFGSGPHQPSADHSGATVPDLHRLPRTAIVETAISAREAHPVNRAAGNLPRSPAMTQLTLICDAGAGDRPAFPDDPPLGWRELAAASRFPPLSRADAAWSSPNARAVQTASALSLAVSLAAALRDCDYGRWSGRRLADVHREEPEALAAWITDPVAKPHGGESVAEVIARVANWLDERLGERGHLVAVTHSVVIRAAIIHAIGATPASCARIDVAPLSRTLLTHEGSSWRLRSHGW